MKRLVSVVIPTHNRAGFLEDSLKSVLEQKLPRGLELEVIVVDDGSTDKTKDVIAKFQDKIIYRYIEASGRPAVPRNIAIKMARGDLVAFQDSDDLWAKDKLVKQLSAFNDPSVVLSYGNAEFMDETGRKSGKTIITSEQAASGKVFLDLLEDNFISTLTVMARRKALIEAGLFNESWKLRGIEDYELWLRVARLGKIRFIDNTLAYYRSHDGNISSKDHFTSHQRLVNVFRSTLKINNLSTDEKRAITKRLSKAYDHLAGFASRRRKPGILVRHHYYKVRAVS